MTSTPNSRSDYVENRECLYIYKKNQSSFINLKKEQRSKAMKCQHTRASYTCLRISYRIDPRKMTASQFLQRSRATNSTHTHSPSRTVTSLKIWNWNWCEHKSNNPLLKYRDIQFQTLKLCSGVKKLESWLKILEGISKIWKKPVRNCRLQNKSPDKWFLRIRLCCPCVAYLVRDKHAANKLNFLHLIRPFYNMIWANLDYLDPNQLSL